MSASHAVLPVLAEEEKNNKAFNAVLKELAAQLMALPFEARGILIESFSTLLLRGFIPISGMTVQQHVSAEQAQLDQLNKAMDKQGFVNSSDPRYVYQFAREATSAGVIPAYRDSKTGDIYLALICNKRNLDMYNWSAGYTEAPLPIWRGQLLSEREKNLQFNRVKMKDVATRTMLKILEEANGDWTAVEFAAERFEKEFKQNDVVLPKGDVNSLHTASRECLEEINLDLEKFPHRKTFLVSHDNTVGISQGDAPGQSSNRSHQYLVFLGDLEAAPEIKPGDDVAIADWVSVRKIVRKSSTEYVANGKPLCVYMLRGIEVGLKMLWQHLLGEASLQKSRYSPKMVSKFSTPENLLTELEGFCDKYQFDIEDTRLAFFMRLLSGNVPSRTYVGDFGQQFLNCMVETARYMMSPELNPETFLVSTARILFPLEQYPKIYSKSALVCHFRLPAKGEDSAAQQAQAQQAKADHAVSLGAAAQ